MSRLGVDLGAVGYYTKFSLRVEPAALHDQVARELTRLAYHDGVTSVFDHAHWNGGIGCKWYEHERDCLALSASMPGVTIKIQGIGEEDGDRWRCVYRDGKEISSTVLGADYYRDAQYKRVDLLTVADAYLCNIVSWLLRHLRAVLQKRPDVSTETKASMAVELKRNAWSRYFRVVDECAWRGILPTVDDLRVAWDVACSRGHVDSDGKPREIVHVCAGPVREGEERPTWLERGPRDLVELWVGYCPREACECEPRRELPKGPS